MSNLGTQLERRQDEINWVNYIIVHLDRKKKLWFVE